MNPTSHTITFAKGREGRDVDLTAQIEAAYDYSPFGVQLPERTFEGEGYRYGFNGMEKDDEIKGAGNSINYKYRMHDPRLGRFFAVDPLFKEYPWNSSYAFSENRVIDGFELEGLEHQSYTVKLSQQGKPLQIINKSSFIWDLGQKGWGATYNFIDESGKKVTQIFVPSDPPIVWTGANRPLYVSGKKVLGNYLALDGPDGFKNGGYQTMIGTATMIIGVGEIAAAKSISQTLFGVLNAASGADDILGQGSESLSQSLVEGANSKGLIGLSKGALSFASSIKTTLSLIDGGADAVTAVSKMIDTFGSVQGFQSASENFSREVEDVQNGEVNTDRTDEKN